jgi:pimeloyl-ACP methyl ester carboxylesterase
MVAQAHAALYPEATDRIALLDVPHPDESWADMRLLPEPDQYRDTVIENGDRSYLWWFAFNQVRGLPEKLLDGRSRLLVDWLFDRQAKNPATIDEHSRQIYALAYSTADAVRAGNGWYQTFNVDIADQRAYPKLDLPVLALGGDMSNYVLLRDGLPAKATDVRVVKVSVCGHYIPEERPGVVIDELTAFLA